jgi:hypothetical protein
MDVSDQQVLSVLMAAAGEGKTVEVNHDRISAITMLAEHLAREVVSRLVSEGKLSRIHGHVGRTGHPLYWINCEV